MRIRPEIVGVVAALWAWDAVADDFAARWPEAAIVAETPALSQLAAFEVRLSRAGVDLDRPGGGWMAWAPPLPWDGPWAHDRGAWFVVAPSGASLWIYPLAAETVADDGALAAWMAAQGAEPIESRVADWHLSAPVPEFEAACRRVRGGVACQRPVGPEGPVALAGADVAKWPSGERWQVLARPSRLTEWSTGQWLRHAERRARLLEPAARQQAMARAASRARRWAESLDQVPRVSVDGTHRGAQIRASLTMELAPETWRQIERALGQRAPDPRLIGWSRTPALVQVWATLEPSMAQRLMGTWLGQTVPGLRGDFGVLWLGVRGSCEGCGPRADIWPVLFPTAAAFKVETPPGPSILSTPSDGGDRGQNRIEIQTHAGPTELVIEDETVFVATGTGLGSAAHRRWKKCHPIQPEPSAVAHVQADLHAIRAALEAVHGPQAPGAVTRLAKTVDGLWEVLGHQRWVVLDVSPAAERTLRVDLETRP